MASSQFVAIRDIRLSPKRAKRASGQKVEQYRRAVEAGSEFPPLKLIALSDGTYDLSDGRHRYLAQVLAGYTQVEAIVF